MLITQAEFARRHNVTRQAVADWVKRGVIQLADGLVDEVVALAAIAAVHDPGRPSKVLTLISGPAPTMTAAELPAPAATAPAAEAPASTTEESISFHQAKTRRELAEAERAELRLAKERGELVELDLVLATWANLVNAARTRVLAVATSPDIPETLRAITAKRLAEALEELAYHDPRQLVTTE